MKQGKVSLVGRTWKASIGFIFDRADEVNAVEVFGTGEGARGSEDDAEGGSDGSWVEGFEGGFGRVEVMETETEFCFGFVL